MSNEEIKNTESIKNTVAVKFDLSKELHKKLKMKALDNDKTMQ